MEMIRTFVAIELDEALLKALCQVANVLKRAPVARLARWVSPDGIHLTLKFLGDVSSDRVPEITQAIERGCHSFAPFRVSLSSAGFFPGAGYTTARSVRRGSCSGFCGRAGASR